MKIFLYHIRRYLRVLIRTTAIHPEWHSVHPITFTFQRYSGLKGPVRGVLPRRFAQGPMPSLAGEMHQKNPAQILRDLI
jgi:hypothetical protein